MVAHVHPWSPMVTEGMAKSKFANIKFRGCITAAKSKQGHAKGKANHGNLQ